MPDYYINKEDLLKKLSKDCPQICDDKVDVYGLGAYSQYQGDINTIVNMPSVDAVEVVRCKDCKYFKETSEIKGECTYWKVLPTIYPFKEDYCTRGEKDGEAKKETQKA